MKATKLLCLVLTIAMMIPMAVLMSSAITVGGIEAIDAVETYGQGKIIFDEDDFKDDVASNFKMYDWVSDKAEEGTRGSVTFNEETGMLVIKSGGASMLTDIVAIPKNLVNYTIQADLYMSTNTKKFGLGINSTQKWGNGTYMQA